MKSSDHQTAPRIPTILIVDDDTAVRKLVVRMLRRNGFHVLEAGTAEIALSVLQGESCPVDLVAVDMVLPGISGLDLAAELEREESLTRILYMSGYGTSIAMQSILLHSAGAVLLKPFTEPDLIERIRHLLGADVEKGESQRQRARTANMRWSA